MVPTASTANASKDEDRAGMALVLGIAAAVGLAVGVFYVGFAAVTSGFLDAASWVSRVFAFAVIAASTGVAVLAAVLAYRSLASTERRGIAGVGLAIAVLASLAGLVALVVVTYFVATG
jgi:hypothetical protein